MLQHFLIFSFLCLFVTVYNLLNLLLKFLFFCLRPLMGFVLFCVIFLDFFVFLIFSFCVHICCLGVADLDLVAHIHIFQLLWKRLLESPMVEENSLKSPVNEEVSLSLLWTKDVRFELAGISYVRDFFIYKIFIFLFCFGGGTCLHWIFAPPIFCTFI